MANDIIREEDKERVETPESGLVDWVMDHVNKWEQHRKTNYDDKFKEYYRLFRGIWNSKDRTRDTETSKLISPALQQAIEAQVAEFEEAIFGKGVWFDVSDDVLDNDKNDMAQYRDILREDLELAEVPASVVKALQNGAIWGNGIGKIIIEEIDLPTLNQEVVDEGLGIKRPGVKLTKRILIKLEPLIPMEFVIDPSARDIDEALGCAHVVNKPKHTILEKQAAGIYKNVPLGRFPEGSVILNLLEQSNTANTEDLCKIVEYHGKVPRALLPEDLEDDEIIASLFDEQTIDVDETDLVEAIVTIANDTVLLRADENPLLMQDRSIISYQHDTVTDSFWGRGVAEKGYNAQKALDAELRARIDAMAFSSHPMVAADATRLPRGADYKVRPGKVWLTTGNPSETFMPFMLNGANQATFHQSGDLERMVQMATGAMDSAAPITQNPRNQTASGMSMMQSQFIKRSKRSLQNIDRQFLSKLIYKVAVRYVQFMPERYTSRDPNFKVHASMGIMAREYEQGQLTHLLSIVPSDSAVFGVILKGIFENSSLTNKTELLAGLQQMFAPKPEEQAATQAQLQAMQLELRKTMAEIDKLKSEATRNVADAKAKLAQVDVANDKNLIEAFKVDSSNEKVNNDKSRIK